MCLSDTQLGICETTLRETRSFLQQTRDQLAEARAALVAMEHALMHERQAHLRTLTECQEANQRIEEMRLQRSSVLLLLEQVSDERNQLLEQLKAKGEVS